MTEEVKAMKEPEKLKVVIIGLDGATWDLLTPLIEKGKLPTIKKLVENGVHGKLQSTIPPVTIPAWLTFATCKNPGKLGCYDFLMPRDSLNDMRPITSKDIQSKTFYELVHNTGKKCTIINLPGSFPPKIKETVITDFLTQGEKFIFPPNLIDEIPELKNYRLVPDRSLSFDGKIIEYVNDIRLLEKTRFECAKKLFKKEWDLFFILFSASDWIQHMVYDKLISGFFDNDSDPVKAYEDLDKYISWFINNAPQNTFFFLMSDHGFASYEKTFFVNEWLKNEGYVVMEHQKKPRPARHKIEEETRKAISNKITIKFPFFLIRTLKYFKWAYPIYLKIKKVIPLAIEYAAQPDMKKTVAYMPVNSVSNIGLIYINDIQRFSDGIVCPENYEKIRTEIMNKLRLLKDNGNLIFKSIKKREDIYNGSLVKALPDIVFILNDEYCVSHLNVGEVIKTESKPKNQHYLQGIFIAYGPNINKNFDIQNAEISDIGTTVLHLFGIPIPNDMDGKVLKQIYEGGSNNYEKDIIYKNISYKNKIKEKIKKLKDERNNI